MSFERDERQAKRTSLSNWRRTIAMSRKAMMQFCGRTRARSVVDSELAPFRCGCSLVTQSRAEYQTSPGGVEGRERLPPLNYPE
jgi:hypothetical protein